MVAVGLTVAVTVWNGAADPIQLTEAKADAVSADGQPAASANAATDAGVAETLAEKPAAEAASERQQAMVRKIVEGDTVRSLAAEYSVSMSTILASNKFDNPDLIQPGQDIIIPPVDGVVTDVKEGETLAQVAERYGVEGRRYRRG